LAQAKTNAMRILESLGIDFQIRVYDVDDENLDAVTVAAKVGLPPEQVFKTLLVRGDVAGPLFAVIPGNMELDFKALARLSGNRSTEMIPLKEVTPLTGYVRGGVTVLGAKKAYPAYVDFTIELWEIISISAGVRGMQLLLSPSAYLRAVQGTTGRDRPLSSLTHSLLQIARNSRQLLRASQQVANPELTMMLVEKIDRQQSGAVRHSGMIGAQARPVAGKIVQTRKHLGPARLSYALSRRGRQRFTAQALRQTLVQPRGPIAGRRQAGVHDLVRQDAAQESTTRIASHEGHANTAIEEPSAPLG
jgi:Cys-tRNA(Pro)/Cys-tRNA(Cys) deacylase